MGGIKYLREIHVSVLSVLTSIQYARFKDYRMKARITFRSAVVIYRVRSNP